VPRRLTIAVAVLGVGVVAGCVHQKTTQPSPENPFEAKAQYDGADPALEAAAAAASARGDAHASEVLERLDAVPTGIWLTPEQHPTPEDVGGFAEQVTRAADLEDQTALLVVYGVPGRDCTGGQSSGGLTPDTYLPWVRAIADAAGDSAVVLEPDALPSAVQCGVQESRVALLEQAVAALDEADVTTYVDAGHSSWVPVDQIADLLEQVGVESVRGFTTNVSNYQPLSAETAFAEELSDRLGGAHYLVDTGRNGIGTGPVTDWCNPPGQALGHEPGYVEDETALDGYVWVKPPGESDGSCHGGPPAGQLWPERAVALATAAGW
jgi:endoglucanase